MKLERDGTGDLFIDPDILAQRLCLHPLELRRRIRAGLVTSLIEVGTGADSGYRRVTMRTGRTAWRATVAGDDTVVREERLSLADPPSAPATAAGIVPVADSPKFASDQRSVATVSAREIPAGTRKPKER